MIVFANAKVATQQIKAAIEGALKLGMEMDLFITRAWGSDSDMPSTFFKIIHNFRNDYRLLGSEPPIDADSSNEIRNWGSDQI